MNTIKSRFNHQISKIDVLFTRSELHENPGLWLFLNDLRTPIFMMEGLCRIYDEINGDKIFGKMYGSFKDLEDILGAIDHYVAMFKLFENNKKVDEAIIDYFFNKAHEKVEILNEILEDDGWLDGKTLSDFHKKLKLINDLSLEDENKAIIHLYTEEIQEIIDFVNSQNFSFDDMESDVHELRRKIRWLSIYAHSLNGAVQLAPSKSKPTIIKKYLTEKILKSPYNVLPANTKNLATINLDSNSFYALSWIIAELGSIKDQGITVHALVEAIQEASFEKDAEALEMAYKIMGAKSLKNEKLLEQASLITRTFIEEKHLENLIKE